MGDGVFKMNTDKTIEHYTSGESLEYTFQTFQYNANTVWFLTYMGVFQFKNKEISKVNFSCIKDDYGTYFHSCIKDSKNNIWIATLNGVIKIDEKGNEKLFTTENGLPGNDAWKVFEDREHNIWIVFKSSGVAKLTNQSFTLKSKQLSAADIQAIHIDSLGNRWIATTKGVDYFSKNTVINYKLGHGTKDKVRDIGFNQGVYYFLSEDGLNVFDGEKIINYNSTGDNLFLGECIYLCDNRVFLGSSVSGVAEFKYNEIVYINDSIGMDRIGVFSIVKTEDNLWWYATDNGLYQHNGEVLTKVKEANGLPSGKTRSLVLDKQGRLWVGNSEGVFYKEGDQFQAVYKNDTVNNNSIYSLCFDKEGNLWAGKIDGVDKISIVDGNTTSIRRYDTQKGLKIGSLHNNAMALDSNGHILVGTDRGLLEINPYLDFPNTVESKTHIEDIRLFSQPTDWSLYSDSLDANGFPIDLALEYNQNYFTFNYIGICHTFPEGVRYKTKLEGLDLDWVDREDKRFVIYGNLKPGAYTFLLKSCNNEGIWNKEPVRFSFVINPPFWQTWWFYSICIGIVLAGIWSYIKIRSANYQITLKNEQITLINHEVEEKNNEIMDSINYAKRIQDSILPDSKIKYLMPQSFVYFQPKDVVSGDFYWMKRVEEELLFAAIDCTGHGVPGAFVSMVGFGGLNRAVNEYNLTQPSAVLEKLSEFVVESFAKHQSKSINDGMDASLCALNRKTNVLQYAGANNAIYIVRASGHPITDTKGEVVQVKNLGILNEIKATRRPIGKSDNPTPFENHEVQLEKGDTVYLFTDGFPDQFGGEKGKKYMYKAFKRFLISIQDLPIDQQGERLKKEFEIWTHSIHEQIDDICIMGVKI
jgi:serine phosphatase RsbU (regulator of sigma subunit)/ligand-binding sensor domain-containing protein